MIKKTAEKIVIEIELTPSQLQKLVMQLEFWQQEGHKYRLIQSQADSLLFELRNALIDRAAPFLKNSG